MKNEFNSTDRISVERIVSGKGLAYVYDFLRTKFQSDPKVDEAFNEDGADQGAVVCNNAKDKVGNLCDKAVKIFARYVS